MSSTRIEHVQANDGGAFDAHCALPDAGRGPGILLIQELFGVNDYIRDVAQRLAEMGYVALAPDVFWRVERNVELAHDEASLDRGRSYVQRLDLAVAVDDLTAALRHLRAMSEVDNGVGVLGFCLGGRLAYDVAIQGDPDLVVSYYGGGIDRALGASDQVQCPILFHFGEADAFIGAEQVAPIRDAFEGRDDAHVLVQPGAGHAFDNHRAPMFYNSTAADAAWTSTRDFLDRYLPVKRDA